MSWASKRVTTRVEDRAHSLMGIFNVNMPLLYGEGENAFIRLQEEILKLNKDGLPFIYQNVTNEDSGMDCSGSLLARSPDSFSMSADILLHREDGRFREGLDRISVPFLFTNKGAQVNLLGCPCRYQVKLNPSPSVYERHGWLVLLNCRLRDDIFGRPHILLGDSRTSKIVDLRVLIRQLWPW